MLQRKIKPIILIIGSLCASHSMASGYHFGTQSVTAQSTANASAAEASNASTLFSNPAGLSHLRHHQISTTINLVAPKIKYSNAQAQYYQGGEVAGVDSGKITKNVVVAPHVYGAYKLNDRVTLGLGMYVPFASSTEYSNDSKLKYNINELGLTSIAIEPAVAFKLNEQHSFGAGIIAQYSKAELRKYADWSANSSDATLAALKAAGRLPTDNRAAFAGHAKVKGDDWGIGYHLGWLYDINDRARVGASYRSKVKHNLRGHADWEADGAIVKAQFASSIGQPLSVAGGRGYVSGEEANVKIITPESLSVHGMYRATDKLNVFSDVTWTRHSRFNQVDLEFEHQKAVANTATTGKTSNKTTIKPNWRDTFKVAVGGSYQLSHPLQVRAGIAFDQSPVRDASSRLNTLPDGNRVWFSAGIKYDFNKNHSLDVAYSHVHINNTSFRTDKATGDDVDSKGASSADFKNSANILGVQYTYQF